MAVGPRMRGFQPETFPYRVTDLNSEARSAGAFGRLPGRPRRRKLRGSPGHLRMPVVRVPATVPAASAAPPALAAEGAPTLGAGARRRPSQAARLRASLHHPALWPALALLALYAFFFVQFAARLIAFPYDLDQGEGYDAWSAWLVNLGQLPYTSNASYPYYSSNYPPLWSYLVSIPMAWTGPGLAPARAVSTVAALLAALAIGLAARRLARSGLAGVLAGGLFLASPYVFHTTPLARVNGTALLFALVGLSLLAGASRRAVLLGTLALLAALFTKQTTLDAVVAGFAFLLVVRPRLGLAAGALLLGLGAAGVGALALATGGAFWLNVVAANANPFDLGQAAWYLRNFTALHAAVLALAVVESLFLARGSAWSPWLFYFPAALAMALTVGKWGAGESYFLGAVAAASVLAGAGAVRLLRLGAHGSPRQRGATGVLVGGLLVAQGLAFAHGPLSEAIPWLPDRGPQAAYLGRAPTAEDRRAGDEIVSVLRRFDGPVLSEDPSFAVAADRGVVANATHLRNLYQAGLWDATGLVADIQAKRYDVIVLNAELYPEPVLAAIGRWYYQARTVRVNGSTYRVFFPGAT